MRHTSLPLLLLAAIACSNSERDDRPSPSATDPTDSTVPTETLNTDDPTSDPPITTFTHGQYILDGLSIVEAWDTNGDGLVDNNLPLILQMVSGLLGSNEFTVDTINAAISASLYPYNVVLFDAQNVSGDLTLDVLFADESPEGLRIESSSYEDDGTPTNRFEGRFVDQTQYTSSSDLLELPLTFVVGWDPIPLRMVDPELEGDFYELYTEGTLHGTIPVDNMVRDLIEPMIPDEGYDITGDGLNESKDEIMDLVWAIAPTAGDVDLGDGETGISALLRVSASKQEF